MTDISQLSSILQSTGETIARDIAEAQGLACDFVVTLSKLEEPYTLAIEAGNPPTLIIDRDYIAKVMFTDDDKERKKLIKKLRRDIAQLVSKIPRMQRTLAIVPIAQAIALSKEAKRLVKTAFPERVIYKIPDHLLDIQSVYSVTVREITTNQSVTLTGPNESYLRAKAIAQLTQLVAMNQILQEHLDAEKFVAEEPVKKILFASDDRGTEIKNEY